MLMDVLSEIMLSPFFVMGNKGCWLFGSNRSLLKDESFGG
ncbi:hypothetical protein D932_02781 [Enterococcus casseliflavus 14-MB-W-14]|nr:hypothetical protein D932_02781 [Enterococcus casseliflavus 14-MB-W-14]